MTPIKADIMSRKDVTVLLEDFYSRLLNDPITKPIFDDINMEEHLPIIINFWCMVLFNEDSYKGNPFNKHTHLNLSKKHFQTWLFHFERTIKERHDGNKAELAVQRAKSIAFIFQSKLGAY